MAPKDMTTRNEGQGLHGQARPRLKVRQTVWLTQKHRLFKKGYLLGWTKEVFIVQRIMPGPVTTYQLTQWDGTPLSSNQF